MSEKLLYSLTDEHPDLQKQIGCMNGILQIFNRRQFLTSRRISNQNHKRLPPGLSGNHGTEPNSMTHKAIERNLKDAVKEKQRVSVESSRTSFSSSSCSSTFSSVDCNKIPQSEPSLLCPSTFPGTPSQMLTLKQPHSSSHLGQKSLDLRGVVKDSISRDTSVLSVKTTKAKGVSHGMKHVDSPRPLQLSKSVKLKISVPDGSAQVLSKLRGAPQSSNREKSQALPPKDAPRFSYDERASRDKWKSAVKVKELPRLSLDGKEGTIRRLASESRSRYLLDDLQRGSLKSSQTLNSHQEPGSNKRPSSVVAKLMGLDDLLDSVSSQDDQPANLKCCADEDLDRMSTTPRKTPGRKHIQVSSSPRTPQMETAPSRLRNLNPAMKPNSRIPLEPAPWRQRDTNQSCHKLAFKYHEAHKEAQNSCTSVYGEIEKRLKELEFKKSGKDLRALKQILEAMQKTRERLENKREDHASDLEPQRSSHGPDNNPEQNSALATQHSHIIPTIMGTGPPKKLESSIVIIKSAKVAQKPRNSGSSTISIEGISGLQQIRTRDNADSKDLVPKRKAKDLTPKNNISRESSCQPFDSTNGSTNARRSKSMEPSKALQQMSEGIPTSSGKSSTTVSPRLQLNKHGMEKQLCPTSQTFDSSRARRHLSKQQVESGSPRRKLEPKSPNLQQGDEFIELGSKTRQWSHQGDAVSVKSESSISLASQTDIEVTSTLKEINGAYQLIDQRKEVAARLSEDRSKAEPTTATLEQPSPVSVLDITFYREESPSPVKKISNAFEEEDTLDSDEEGWNLVDRDYFLNSRRPNLSPEFDREKLENINHLVHKLRQVNFPQDEAVTDCIASLCESKNPEHRYITEILLASGMLLQDLGSSSTIIQLHPSGHLINPSLFHVLEQSKGKIQLPDDECSSESSDRSDFNQKIPRKLIFDTVNEILARKLTSAGFCEPWISPKKLQVRSFSQQKLLKELCSEMDHLQANHKCNLADGDNGSISILSDDLMHQTQIWADFPTEVPGLVLGIERLIFKDLIDEIVIGEAAGLQGMPTKQCRQLFAN